MCPSPEARSVTEEGQFPDKGLRASLSVSDGVFGPKGGGAGDFRYSHVMPRWEHREQTGRIRSQRALALTHNLQDFCLVLLVGRPERHLLQCRTRDDSDFDD
jgi:hypothetical protein